MKIANTIACTTRPAIHLLFALFVSACAHISTFVDSCDSQGLTNDGFLRHDSAFSIDLSSDFFRGIFHNLTQLGTPLPALPLTSRRRTPKEGRASGADGLVRDGALLQVCLRAECPDHLGHALAFANGSTIATGGSDADVKTVVAASAVFGPSLAADDTNTTYRGFPVNVSYRAALGFSEAPGKAVLTVVVDEDVDESRELFDLRQPPRPGWTASCNVTGPDDDASVALGRCAANGSAPDPSHFLRTTYYIPQSVPATARGSVTILSGSNLEREWSEDVRENHFLYAMSQGYEYKYVEMPEWGNVSDYKEPQWLKVRALLDTLRNTASNYVLWVDDDIAFTSRGDFVTSMIDDMRGKSLMIARDIRLDQVNTGIMLFRRGEESIAILEKVWRASNSNLGYCREQSCFHEQEALNGLINQGAVDARVVNPVNALYNMNTMWRKSHYDEVRKDRGMSMYLDYDEKDPPQQRWNWGMNTAHVSGMTPSCRSPMLKWITEYARRFIFGLDLDNGTFQGSSPYTTRCQSQFRKRSTSSRNSGVSSMSWSDFKARISGVVNDISPASSGAFSDKSPAFTSSTRPENRSLGVATTFKPHGRSPQETTRSNVSSNNAGDLELLKMSDRDLLTNPNDTSLDAIARAFFSSWCRGQGGCPCGPKADDKMFHSANQTPQLNKSLPDASATTIRSFIVTRRSASS